VLRRRRSDGALRFAFAGHDFKDLFAILENYPRDDMFQMEADELLTTTLGILACRNGGGSACSCTGSSTAGSCHVSCTSPRPLRHPVRVRIANLLLDAFGAELSGTRTCRRRFWPVSTSFCASTR
jgi:glutamate dehydrogenase